MNTISKNKRLHRVVALVIGGAVALTACTTVGADRVGVKYTGGDWDGIGYDGVELPGGASTFLVNDDMYQVPTSNRTYVIADGDPNADVKEDISVPSSDQSTVVDYKVLVSFVLNTRTDDIENFKGGTLRKFMENVCFRYNCINPSDVNDWNGWDTMLQKTMKPAIMSAFKDTVRGFDGNAQVYNLTDETAKRPTLDVVKEQAGKRFLEELNRLLGGQYFCGPGFDRNNKASGCPPVELSITKVEFNNPDLQKAREEKRIADERAAAKEAEARGLQKAQAAISEALKDPAYVRYLESQNKLEAAKACANSAKSCVLIIGDGGANINIPVPAGG